ncbi:MAG TPA: ACP S-malonyltransferase, partial [Gemmatimonadaceae bacterium]|nr:ACP S-malonyltransferase [Gemmatimonadaceae bacterium]
TLADGARLVRRRGELMLAAGEERPGAMAAVLGDLSEPIESLCERATAEAGLVVPANYNAPGQLVVSGDSAGVDRLAELAKEAGAKRAVRLNVSGAFHSPLMQPAAEGLATALADTAFATPAFPVASNVSAELVTAGDEARELLRRQLTSPVRWTELVRTLATRHPDALFVELGPGNVLTGLMKRIAPDAATATCGTPAEVESLLQRLG